jgi:hypothetical protein
MLTRLPGRVGVRWGLMPGRLTVPGRHHPRVAVLFVAAGAEQYRSNPPGW